MNTGLPLDGQLCQGCGVGIDAEAALRVSYRRFRLCPECLKGVLVAPPSRVSEIDLWGEEIDLWGEEQTRVEEFLELAEA